MSRKLTNYRLNGKQSKSLRAQNKQISAQLPSPNSAFCQSVYDFIKIIIGDQGDGTVPVDQKAISESIETRRLHNQTTFLVEIPSSYKPEYAGKKKSILTKYKWVFLHNLKEFNISHSNFDYTQPASSTWNSLIITLLCKHWTYAETQNAFSAYAIDLDDMDPTKLSGVITRWFNGKKALFAQKKQIDPAKKNAWRRSWYARNVLVKRRVRALKSLGIPAECCEAFEEPLCHSDTEELADNTLQKLKLPWRSAVLADLCAVADRATFQATCPAKADHRLLETRRRPAQSINEKAKVPMNLPRDAYDTEFLKSLSEPEQRELTKKPPSGLTNFYFQLTQNHSNLCMLTQHLEGSTLCDQIYVNGKLSDLNTIRWSGSGPSQFGWEGLRSLKSEALVTKLENRHLPTRIHILIQNTDTHFGPELESRMALVVFVRVPTDDDLDLNEARRAPVLEAETNIGELFLGQHMLPQEELTDVRTSCCPGGVKAQVLLHITSRLYHDCVRGKEQYYRSDL
ncbi:hypothetical protein PTTG_12271 [Puccinia triticina 1-1 BBBD Race 1]|uniref:Uncharacterized protein n=1 Tax=Puccinia triticina (isolate 1-1 / race 1 (BBBD)) TaxID=630390 RepID=A0A180G5U4_PUCT1|nr:hypothetical protein PTTG_12271 [Puccinia triticina 1-1 BBBD Race 1]